MLDFMPTVDETENWEEAMSKPEGEVKFPVSLLDSDILASVAEIGSHLEKEIKISDPVIRNNRIQEIKLGKSSKKNNKNKLF